MSGTPDGGTRFIILGALRAVSDRMYQFIDIRSIDEDFDDQGIAQSFTITTASGRRYRISVEQIADAP